MAPLVYFENNHVTHMNVAGNTTDLKEHFSQQFGIPHSDFFVLINGKPANSNYKLLESNDVVRICSRLLGGKGGFGSMLRAIGAQIEKTTNREACRDLSGRRLRDINEEKRLRKWLEGQGDREREAAERKLKKLERLVSEPKVSVKLDDPVYEKERHELPERVSAAVDAGWQASAGEGSSKRKSEEPVKSKGKKKAKLWIDADLSDCSSSEEDNDDAEGEKASPGPTVSTDSGNESDQVSEANAKQ